MKSEEACLRGVSALENLIPGQVSLAALGRGSQSGESKDMLAVRHKGQDENRPKRGMASKS